MKYTFILLLTLMIISCAKEESQEETKPENCTEVAYGQEVTLLMDDVICFPDGNSLTFTTAAGEFCPCEAMCIWAGQLSILIETEETTGEKDLINFGSESYKDSNQIFESRKINSLRYEYNDPDVQDCMNNFDEDKISISLIID